MGRIHEALKKADEKEIAPPQEIGSDTDSSSVSESDITPVLYEAPAPISDSEIVTLSDEIPPQPVESETAEQSEDASAADPESEDDTNSEDASLPALEAETSPVAKTEIVPISTPETAPLFAPKASFEYQSIKTKIITRFSDNAIKTIMITGTSRQCGTSTTSVGFATTLAADCKSRVLLIEANTRLPSFSRFFNLQPGLGLSDLFSPGTDEELLPFQTAVTNNLYVIPAGERKPGVNTFFESDRFDAILDQFRRAFDYVILDAPPVISHDEPKVLGKKVDGVILVSRSGKSRQRVAIRAKNELETSGATILGVVLNRRKHYIPEWLYKRL